MKSLHLAQHRPTFLYERPNLRNLDSLECLLYQFIIIAPCSILNLLPSLSLYVVLGQPDDALHGIVVRAIARVIDQPDLQLLGLILHFFCPMHRQPVQVEGQLPERVQLSQSTEKLAERLSVDGPLEVHRYLQATLVRDCSDGGYRLLMEGRDVGLRVLSSRAPVLPRYRRPRGAELIAVHDPATIIQGLLQLLVCQPGLDVDLILVHRVDALLDPDDLLLDPCMVVSQSKMITGDPAFWELTMEITTPLLQ